MMVAIDWYKPFVIQVDELFRRNIFWFIFSFAIVVYFWPWRRAFSCVTRHSPLAWITVSYWREGRTSSTPCYTGCALSHYEKDNIFKLNILLGMDWKFQSTRPRFFQPACDEFFLHEQLLGDVTHCRKSSERIPAATETWLHRCQIIRHAHQTPQSQLNFAIIATGISFLLCLPPRTCHRPAWQYLWVLVFIISGVISTCENSSFIASKCSSASSIHVLLQFFDNHCAGRLNLRRPLCWPWMTFSMAISCSVTSSSIGETSGSSNYVYETVMAYRYVDLLIRC